MNEPNWVFWGGSDSGGWFGFFFFTFFDPRQVFSLMKVSFKKKKRKRQKYLGNAQKAVYCKGKNINKRTAMVPLIFREKSAQNA